MNASPNESKRAQVNNLCPNLQAGEAEVERLFQILDRFGGFDSPSGELSIAFVSKLEISRIHALFMQDDSPTDVITFPGDPEQGIAGEICVCPDIAYEYSQSHDTDFSEELSLYLAHGYLHLCGFDDLDDENRTSMRNAESIAMKTLKEQNALPRFSIKG